MASEDSITVTTADLDAWLVRLSKCERLTEAECATLVAMAKNLCDAEETVVSLKTPLTLVGDIHGQWHDLAEVFRLGGGVREGQRYVFLGDYVDRGYHSIECVQWVVALKVRFPDRVWLLRGNHESRQVTQVYGFYDECLRKYGNPRLWKAFTDLFDFMPLAALVDGKIFCVHGGLSPALETLDAVKAVQRRVEVPHEGPICDLMWSDPEDFKEGWGVSPRGAGYTWGPNITKKWHNQNGLDLTVRAHQLVMEGFAWGHEEGLLTLFSAPNYSYRCGNRAAILVAPNADRSQFKLIAFDAVQRANEGANMARRTPDYFL